jgi:hydrogenase/urease accessory protein HupE
VVFPVVMALGGAAGVLGLPLPAVETGIALSGVLLGLLVALEVRPPLWVAAVVVGCFGLFHGHAHGTELPGSANAVAYSIGFVVSTGLLHLCGIAMGLLAGRRRPLDLRAPMGWFIALSGAGLMVATAAGVKAVHPALPLGVALGAGALLVLGLDSAVEAGSSAGVAKMLAGTWLSLVVLVYDVAIYVSLGGEARWLGVALRVAGSWIIAVALMVLAFSLRRI